MQNSGQTEWRTDMKNNTLQGIPGMLRPFKEYLETWSLPEGAEVVFFGVPGTCTPFVELLCYAVRSLPCTFLFVPYLHENESRKMIYTEGLGYQAWRTLSGNQSFGLCSDGRAFNARSSSKD